MDTNAPTVVTVETRVSAPVERTWTAFTDPVHVVRWNHASDDWHSPRAENDLRPGGSFNFRMEARDGSLGFDFMGVYDEVRENEFIAYTMGDGRKVQVSFRPEENMTLVTESFVAENTHSVDMQRAGWQAILDNFKNYVEGSLFQGS